jgi:hypothetical protein
MGLDEHIDTIYTENDMAPPIIPYEPGLDEGQGLSGDNLVSDGGGTDPGYESVSRAPETYVLFEQGYIEQRVVHDQARIEQRRAEREHEAFAQRYAVYAQSTPAPMPFEQFVKLMRMLSE